jgi:hypothetical protein
MTCKIKRLSLAFVVIGAMSLAAASAALAAEFHAEGGPNVSVTGEQTEAFKLQLTGSGATVNCTQVLFEGTIQGGTSQQTTAQELTLTPTHTGCKAFGLSATVEMNGCKFTVTAAGQAANTTVFDIAGCTVGKSIQAKTLACTITVPEQTGLSHAVGATNAGPPKDIEVNNTLQGITYQLSGAGCSGTTGVTTHDADLIGKATFRAFQDLGSEVATHNGHQYNKLKCGAQLGLFAT